MQSAMQSVRLSQLYCSNIT